MKRRHWIFLGLGAFLIIMLHLYISSLFIGLSYQNTEQKVQWDKLQSENRKLRAILAQRRSYEVLEKKAKELGFEPPQKVVYLLLPTRESETR